MKIPIFMNVFKILVQKNFQMNFSIEFLPHFEDA